MKKVILTALTVSLLAGTSALVGGGGAAAQSGLVGRTVQEAQRRSESQGRQENQARPERPAQQARPERQAPAAAAARPAPEQRPQGEGRFGRGGRDGIPGAAARGAAQAAPQSQAIAPQRPGQSGSFVGRTVEEARRRAEAQGRGPDWNNGRGGRDGDGRGGRDGDWNGRGGRDGDWNNGNGRGPDWDRDRWNRDRNRPRYDQRYWPHFVQPSQRYRWYGPSWVGQPGFYYRNWGYGEVLPWNWYTPRYYLSDYWRYGLREPPAGFEWVRVGRDAMLVDVFNGQIYQVVRLLFW